jgi:hypothetical protein
MCADRQGKSTSGHGGFDETPCRKVKLLTDSKATRHLDCQGLLCAEMLYVDGPSGHLCRVAVMQLYMTFECCATWYIE